MTTKRKDFKYKWELVAEDVAWLESFGVHPYQIAKQLGRTVESTATILRRHGLNELAQPFYDELQYMKTGVTRER